MYAPVRRHYESLKLDEVLDAYPGLRVVPTRASWLTLRGTLEFSASGPEQEVIEDEYEVEIRVYPEFPAKLPRVWEKGGRIEPDFHTMPDGHLCLGAPTRLRLALTTNPSLLAFVNQALVPYLYGHAFYLKHKRMPFGELAHGDRGLRDHLAEMFRALKGAHPEDFLRLAGMKKSLANKYPCPCGSGIRLGKCHNRIVNGFRRRYGRKWFREEYGRVVKGGK